ncbi:hypothetical protein BDV18DRAFT_160448 [Aspergillus unguis]
MVSTSDERGALDHSNVTVSGIVDWEMCGWYPGYWEYVKALHTIIPRDPYGDWYAYLPPSIVGGMVNLPLHWNGQ